MNEKLKEPKPQSLGEVPGYLARLISKFFSRLFYIVKLVWEARPSLLFIMMFMALFNGIMPVIGAQISANLITSLAEALFHIATTGEAMAISSVLLPLILQFGYLFFNNLVNHINTIITRLSSEMVTNHIKVKIMNKAREIDLASFDMPDFYERLENANREAGVRPINVLNATFRIISTAITIISFIVVLINIAWWAPLVVIALAVPSAIISFYYRKKNFQYMRRRSKDRRQMTYYSDLLVNKDLAKEVRLFGLSDTFIGRYNEVFKRYFGGIKKLIWHEGAWNISISLVTSTVNCLLFLFVANQVRIGGIDEIGNYQLYTGALNSIAGGVATLISTVATIYEGTLFIDNMILFMNEEKHIQALLPEKAASIKRHCGHTIEFRHVSFVYPGTTRKVLDDINLRLDPGDTAVLVGLNGAGKTTLIKLLTRLYDPTEGVILFDGKDIREYDPQELYKVFGIIFQDFGKYAVSVTENISFGQVDKPIVEDEIRDAAINSSADEYIQKLPQQYDTPLMRYFEKEGIELSIGQWQKLSIARAFYSDSDILILDEPTASLDPMAEQEIFNQFDKLAEDKTTVFVSHRLSSATAANKIIVLEYGKIIEMGDHKTLMTAHGKYFELFSTQAKRYISSEEEMIREENFDNQRDRFRPDGSRSLPPHDGRPPMPDNRPDGRPPHRPPHNG
ncbi:MAG: ABC transporter ATP-binding protein [Clostridia bacterium]|nr:ABC transporter ATP-binding protein [Clostridia bacterium]